MKIRTVIVDDDPLAVQLFEKLLQDFCPEVEEIRCFVHEEQAIQYLNNHQTDLIFLDVTMGQMSGFDLLDLLPNVKSRVVIVSASDKHILTALRNRIFDYIVKPVSPDALVKVIKRYRNASEAVYGTEGGLYRGTLLVNRHDKVFFIPHRDIIRIEANGPYSRIYTADDTIQTSKTMLYLEQRLPADLFIRVNRSLLVNRSYVKMIKKHADGSADLYLIQGEKIPLSKQLKDRFISEFEE